MKSYFVSPRLYVHILCLNKIRLIEEGRKTCKILAQPDVPADVGLFLGEVLPAEQVIELVHGQANDLLDGEGDACLASKFLVLKEKVHHFFLLRVIEIRRDERNSNNSVTGLW